MRLISCSSRAQAERRALRRISLFRAKEHNPTGHDFPTWDVGLGAPLPAELTDRNFQRNRRLGESRKYVGGAPYMLICPYMVTSSFYTHPC